MPNPLRCFNFQRFGHHENNCPVDIGSVCERCGKGGDDHHTNQCTNPAKCVNCGKDHLSRSSECEVWKKEKEIMKLKVTKNLTYPEGRKLYDQQQPEFTFAKVVQSLSVKPETKTASTQYNVEDSKITESSTVIVAKKTETKFSIYFIVNNQCTTAGRFAKQNEFIIRTTKRTKTNKQTEYEHKTNK